MILSTLLSRIFYFHAVRTLRVSGKATMAFNGKISSQLGKNAAPAC